MKRNKTICDNCREGVNVRDLLKRMPILEIETISDKDLTKIDLSGIDYCSATALPSKAVEQVPANCFYKLEHELIEKKD